MPIIAPSMLAADFANIQRDTELINNSSADWFHIDIMDGVFRSQYQFWFSGNRSHSKSTLKKPLDVHLMIVKPRKLH